MRHRLVGETRMEDILLNGERLEPEKGLLPHGADLLVMRDGADELWGWIAKWSGRAYGEARIIVSGRPEGSQRIELIGILAADVNFIHDQVMRC